MINIKNLKPLEDGTLQELSISWINKDTHTTDALIEVSKDEAEAYYEAANTLYDMYVEAAEYVIENDLFFEVGIPFNLVESIKKSWENDVHWHICGAFSFSGGCDNKPLKLIDFKADTPKYLLETSLLQWAILKENNLDEKMQYNDVYNKISENFKRLITLFDDIDNFEEKYNGWKILFSCDTQIEEENNTKFLQQMAKDAGFETSFSFLADVNFGEDGISDENEQEYEYWFKNYPWLKIATDESELATTITNIMKNQKAIILNPAYTLLFESRGMMKILKDMYPDSPYLLETSFEESQDVKSVKRAVFGEDGEYKNFKDVYQEYNSFLKDANDSSYTANVFFSYEACGLSFEKNAKTFMGHIIV